MCSAALGRAPATPGPRAQAAAATPAGALRGAPALPALRLQTKALTQAAAVGSSRQLPAVLQAPAGCHVTHTHTHPQNFLTFYHGKFQT